MQFHPRELSQVWPYLRIQKHGKTTQLNIIPVLGSPIPALGSPLPVLGSPIPVLGSPIPVLGMKVKREESVVRLFLKINF